jgi:hypothetical protein
MKKLTILFLLVLCMFQSRLEAQWSSLPDNTCAAGPCLYCFSPYQSISIPAGKTIFSGLTNFQRCSAPTSMFGLARSTDDFQSSPNFGWFDPNSSLMQGIFSINPATCQVIYSDPDFQFAISHGGNAKGSHCTFPNPSGAYIIRSLYGAGRHSYCTGYASDSSSIAVWRIDTAAQTTRELIVFKNMGDTTSLFFVNDSTGFLTCNNKYGNGLILKTSDFGNTWSKLLTSWQMLGAIQFPKPGTGYAAGGGGTIYKSTDAGTSWNLLTPITTASFRIIYFLNPDTGYVGGTGGELYRTNNGGGVWNTENSTTTNTITYIKMTDDSTAYFCAERCHVYKCTHDLPTGIRSEELLPAFSIFPNPSGNGSFTLTGIKEGQIIEIYTLPGNKCYSAPITGTIQYLNLSSQPQGIYFYRILSENKLINSGKLVIQ